MSNQPSDQNRNCLFVTDLHGRTDRYQKLFALIKSEQPEIIFLGGDLLPHFSRRKIFSGQKARGFLDEVLIDGFSRLKEEMANSYPHIFIILGNDDGKLPEQKLLNAESQGIWHYVHNKRVDIGAFQIYGYANVPPSPFLNKDWERYDISRYVDPGCISPEDGFRSVKVRMEDVRYGTIEQDLDALCPADGNYQNSVFLFHTPPYKTNLDRAALDGKMIDHVPLDVYVGSIAVRQFIEKRQPLITLHGHIHESPRITGSWKNKIGRTHLFSAAHDGPELAVVRFSPEKPENATRELL